jgi:hypothetical protein
MKKFILLSVIVMSVAGCVGSEIDAFINRYNEMSNKINLGDSKERALSILLPTQKNLFSKYSKSPEKYMKDGVVVEIYFMRSRRQPDGLTTDDEFTPYVFNDGKLVGIGWQVLGGPSSQGQAPPVIVY